VIKLYLFDVDGVLLDGRPLDGKPWKSTLKDDLGIDPSELKRLFFKPHWQSIVTGKKKIIPYLDDALHKMETPTTATGLLDYWFSNDGRQVSACVALLEGLHDAGKKLALQPIKSSGAQIGSKRLSWVNFLNSIVHQRSGTRNQI